MSHRTVSLLLQFILSELFEAHKIYDGENWEKIVSAQPRFFPYDWNMSVGHLNKTKEHSALLGSKKFDKHLEKIMKKQLSKELLRLEIKKLYLILEPFMDREDENLIFFLLKNRKVIDEVVGKGHLQSYQLETLGEKLCDRYHQRGFFSQIPEFKLLLAELNHG